MSRAALLALFAVAACTGPGPAGEAARRADEAQALVTRAIDCERLGAAIDAQAETAADANRAPVPLGQPLRVRLHELRAVTPSVAPGRKEKAADRFAGLVPFRVAASGTHAVLLASLAWADLAEANPPRLVPPQSFEWLTVCGRRFKSGLYALEPGREYVVQLWDSPDREVTLILRRLP